MPLPKGKTNNPNGRPVGTVNKQKAQLRELIAAFLDKNFHRIEKLIKELPAKDQVRAYIDLLQYSVPKLQSVNLETTFERLPDDQLDELINRLRNGDTIYQERENNLSDGFTNGQANYN
jgi:hypothetical protein